MIARPSPQAVKAAQAAASSPHGFVNLVRLVKSLEASSARLTADEDEPEAMAILLKQVKADELNARYARTMLETLRNNHEQSSTTESSLDDIDRVLRRLEYQYQLAMSSSANGTFKSPATNGTAEPLQRVTTAREPPVNLPPPPVEPMISTQISNSATRIRHRKIPALSDYLAARDREDRQGESAGLLPIPVESSSTISNSASRDRLLGNSAGVGMGAAQLHEELGGQLAHMSHRLKLNAIHFASSLEEEKALLEASQDTLENNLTNTRSSKKDLSAVSKKSRGTTCMTLGVVALVLVVFIWTYMLIRFT